MARKGPKNRHPYMTPEELQARDLRILDLHNQGITYNSLATRFGLTRSVIARILLDSRKAVIITH